MTTKKTMTAEDYKKASMYNITNYLYNCYHKKIEPSPELMANIDFNEYGSKEVTYYSNTMGQSNVNVNETLAQNCMSTLPYEAYGKFVTTDWINFPNDWDGKLVSSAIYSKNISLVEKLHDLGLERALNDKEFANAYTNKCLANILKPTLVSKEDHLPITQPNFGERYLALLRKSAAEINYFHNRMYRLENDESIKYSNNIDWLNKAVDISRHSSSSDPFKNEILVNFVSQPELLPVLEDALVLLFKSNPKDIKAIFGLVPFESEQERTRSLHSVENTLSVAFKHNNLIAAKLIVDSFGLTQEDCLKAYEYNLREEFDRLEHNSYDFEADKSCGISLMTQDFFNKYYKDLKQQFFPDFDTEFLPLFLLTKDSEFKKEILNNTDTLFNTKIPEDLTRSAVSKVDEDGNEIDDSQLNKKAFTINECLYTAKIIETLNNFMVKEGKELVYPKQRSQLKHMKLSDFIIDHIVRLDKELLSSINSSDVPDSCWNKFESPEFKNHINDILCMKQGRKLHPIMFDDFNMLLKTTRLDTQLEQKPATNKNKVKI